MATHQPGMLHTGQAAPGTTGGAPGTLHAPATAGNAAPAATGAAPANRGMFGGRKAHNEGAVAVDSGATHDGGFRVNTKARVGLAITQLLTAIAFTIVLAGLASLQSRANSLTLGPRQTAIYADAFQSGNQIPYPGQGSRQFGLQWWVLAFEVFIFMMIFVLLVFPRYLLRLKHTAMCFLVYVFVLTTLQVDSLLYYNRSPTAGTLFGKRRIKATLAGAMFGCICNALSIILLGLLRDDTGHRYHGAYAHGRGGKRVGVDHTHEPVGPGAV